MNGVEQNIMTETVYSHLDYLRLEKIAQMIYGRLGIRMDQKKFYLLESRLNKVIHRGLYSSFEDFYFQLESGQIEALETLTRFVTTNHTYFFREKEHFDSAIDIINFKKIINPKIWSCACSSGEEPYSLIISLLENKISDFVLIATDVNRDVLHLAHKGIYPISKLEHSDQNLTKKYFLPLTSDKVKIRSDLRNYLKIKVINIMEKVEFDEPFDFIFCRNLLIYFDELSIEKATATLINNLKIGGYLFIGKTETFLNLPKRLRKVGMSIYQKVS